MGIPTLIKALTASNSASLAFVDGASDVVLDSTYDEYMFVFTDINPATDRTRFIFQVNATDDAGGGYDTSLITSTAFCARVYEADDHTASLSYRSGDHIDNNADPQRLSGEANNDADSIISGIMHLFSPSSTTYVKHFYATLNTSCDGGDDVPFFNNHYVAGYINDTTAIDEIQFKCESGNFDGVIQLYGIA
jgi:hypothetical protein